jgi:hypothetical protein
MQFIQFTAARADTGQVLGYAKVTVYLTGTSTLAALFNAAGTSIANPTTADATGLVGVAAVNGSYDGVVTSADGSYSSPTILKLQLFDLAAVTQALAAGTFAGMIAKIKTTLALLNADLVATAGQLALVYADGTASNNDLYVKLGASGAGSWQGPLGFVSNQIAASVASATASAASASASASASGSRLRNGTSNPTGAIGADGDFYLNTVTETMWGPKASGAWPTSGVTLVGPQGTNGSPGTVTNNSFWTTLEAYGAVGDGNPATGAGTDDSAAFGSALAALQAQGGGTLRLGRKCYNLAASITLPNDGSAANTNGVTSMYPVRIEGVGHHAAGEGSAPLGGSILMWTASTGAARMQCYPQGMFQSTGVTYMHREGTSGRPFFFTANTTCMIRHNAFWTQLQGTACIDDVIVYGGTTSTLGSASTSPFQGYGSVFSENYINGCRSIKVQVYANAIRIINNTFWNRCGSSDVVKGAAIIVDGDGSGGAASQFAVGTVIQNNLIEIGYYKYGIDLYRNASQSFLSGNDCYDATAATLAGVRIGATCSTNYIMCSLAPAGLNYVQNDVTGANGNVIIQAESGPGRTSTFPQISAGLAGYPNVFGDTIFNSSNAPTDFQPNGAGVGVAVADAFRVLRSGANASSPGAVAWKIDTKGVVTFSDANSAQSGNVSVAAVGQAEYWAQGKNWGFNGRAGGGMVWNTGTGGSYADIQAFGCRFYDHTGALAATIGNGAGGVNLVTGNAYKINAVQVVGARITGWTASTGTPARGAFAAAVAGTASAAYVQAEANAALTRIAALEARLIALEADARTHGLIN